MNNKITVVIYTHNEEKNIKDAVESARFLTDNIIVIDSESTDNTVDIVKKEKIPIFQFPNCHYVEPAREFGIKKAETDWVFILDADERITKELAEEVLSVIASEAKQSQKERSLRHFVPRDDKITHYKIPRRNIFGNKWLKHGGWWPDYLIRLINKRFFKGWPKQIHSTPQMDGQTGYLGQPLLHYFHGNLEGMVKKTIIFEDIESDLLFGAGRPASTLIFFRKFIGELWRRLIKNVGFMDGFLGIIESIYQAFSKTITYLFLYEKKLKSGSL